MNNSNSTVVEPSEQKTPDYFLGQLTENTKQLNVFFIRRLAGKMTEEELKLQEELKVKRTALMAEYKNLHPKPYDEMVKKMIEVASAKFQRNSISGAHSTKSSMFNKA